MRLACLFAPVFPLQAAGRERPELRTLAAPLGIHPALSPPAQVALTAVNRAAARRGVRIGAGLALARSLCPDLELFALRAEVLARAAEALTEVAARHSPRVEPGPPGLVYVDLAGIGWRGEAEVAAALRADATRRGFEARVGVAGTRAAARAAAGQGTSVHLVPVGHDAAFLAPLPLQAIALDQVLLSALERFGLHAVGELARLPRAEIGARLGAAGVRLHRLCCGEEEEPFQPLASEEAISQGVELEWGVVAIEPLLFALQIPLERAAARLAERALACGALELRLELDPRGFALRRLELGAPTRELPALLCLLRSLLTREPPEAPVVGLSLRLFPTRTRPGQHDLFAPPEQPPELLFATLARVEALIGLGRVGAATVLSGHLPGDEGAAPARFDPPRGLTLVPPGSPGTPQAALRLFRPPRAAEVHIDRGRPTAVEAPGVRGRIVDCAGPWPVEAAWWSDAPRALDCYDVSLGDGGSYRLILDRRAGAWAVQGEYD